MLFHHVPSWVQLFFPRYVWHRSRGEKKVYLTFDDGPVPGITDFVLEELAEREMKATFFMVGENVVKHLSLAKKVRDQGHQIGNHTFNHLNGLRFSAEEYVENVEKCQSTLSHLLDLRPTLFRAPYGRMTHRQIKMVSQTYQIIMWDVLSGDYHAKQLPDRCLRKLKKYIQNGSIILFHDQAKTAGLVREVLPAFLDFLQASGYKSAVL
ncbi:MAG TPA: polysaccharide deacetylase family protein [Cyclobacteriaceae bacterium]|nr:polysaccharide deacetylase family protein [Cyclobacteriaceae bacterium]